MKYSCPKDCRWRNAYCHIQCPKHFHYREENEQKKKERHEELAVIVYQCDQKIKSIEVTKNHKTWKRRKDK